MERKMEAPKRNNISLMFEEIKKSIDNKEYSTITREILAGKLRVSKRTINRYMNYLIDTGKIIRIDLSKEGGKRRLYVPEK